MACISGPSDGGAAEQRKILNKATRAACEALKILDEHLSNWDSAASPETLEWWEKHQLADKEREDREAAKTKAKEDALAGLELLTPEQKKALKLENWKMF